MKNRAHAIGIALFIITATHAFATQNAVATLRIEPDHFLVGLEAMVSVTVTNTGSEPLQLSGRLRLRAVGSNGTSFVLTKPGVESLTPDLYAYADRGDPRLAVPTLHSETFYLRTGVTWPIEGLFRPSFFSDDHFDTPGQYLLRAELLTSDPATSFVSDLVTLKIENPQGRDASVRAVILAAIQNDHSSNRGAHIARDILNRYRDSSYAPYWVVDYHTTDEGLREVLYNDAIHRAPEAYATELKLALLSDYQSLMGEGINNFDLETALAYREKAKVIAEDLTKSQLPYAASEGKTVLTDTLPTPDQLRLQFNARVQKFAVSTGAVIPFVQCVDRGNTKDDPMIALFGFDSPNRLGKYIAQGAANRLRPDDATADLPRYFRPGHSPRPGDRYPVVAVTDHDKAPSWSLDGGVAAVSSTTPQCPPQQNPRPITPLFECLSKEGDSDHLTAAFGYDNPNLVPLRIPYGSANSIAGKGTPPTVFLPGEHHSVFTIYGEKDTTPVWTLQGQTAAGSPGSIQCPSSHGGDD